MEDARLKKENHNSGIADGNQKEETAKSRLADHFKHINGWGIDADPDNEPTYPMKHYTGVDHGRLDYERPPLQKQDVEVLHSNERPSLSAVFGNTLPPSGLSGMIRRFAFKYSEDRMLHWVPLVLADRVNVIEGLLSDLAHGHIPNIIAEKGWKAGWKHDRKGIVKSVATTVIITSVLAALLLNGKKKKKKRKEEHFQYDNELAFL